MNISEIESRMTFKTDSEFRKKSFETTFFEFVVARVVESVVGDSVCDYPIYSVEELRNILMNKNNILRIYNSNHIYETEYDYTDF
jgi:hypothetical protein